MSKCNIKLKFKGTEYSFDNDRDFDAFLRKHEKELSSIFKLNGKGTKGLDKIFSSSSTNQSITVNILDKIQTDFNSRSKKSPINRTNDTETYDSVLEEHDYRFVIENSVGVTKAIENIGGNKDVFSKRVTGKNDDYRDWFNAEFAKKNKSNYTDSKGNFDSTAYNLALTAAWEKEEEKNKRTAIIGEELHTVLEHLVKKATGQNPPDLSDAFKNKYNSFLPHLQKIVDGITSQYDPAKCKYYTEFDICSKELPKGIAEALRSNMGLDHSIKYIAGKIDLLIITESGEAVIVDWKTSNKRVGNWMETDNRKLRENGWWSSAKKLGTTSQVGFYAAMLEQYGIKVKEGILKPIIVELEKDAAGNTTNKITKIKEDTDFNGTNCKGLTRREKYKARRIFYTSSPINFNDATKASENFTKMFPGLNDQLKQNKVKEDQVKEWMKNLELGRNTNFIRKVDPKDNDGAMYVFFKNDVATRSIASNKVRKVLCKTKEELEQKLLEYADQIEKAETEYYKMIGESLYNVISQHGNTYELNALKSIIPENNWEWFSNRFSKYWENGWAMTYSDENPLIGQGIFFFNKNGVTDIVNISLRDLHHVISLENQINPNRRPGHTVIGAKVENDDNIEMATDTKYIMGSQYGNLRLMYIMGILSNDQSWTKNCKIGNISVYNPLAKSEVLHQSVEYINESWRRIVKYFPELDLKILSEDFFVDDVQNYLDNVNELTLANPDIGFDGNIVDISHDRKTKIEDTILTLMSKMRKIYHVSEIEKVSSREGFIYYQLSKALLSLWGYHTYEEFNHGGYIDYGVRQGLMLSNPAQSPSVNVRTADTIFSNYREAYMNRFNSVMNKFETLVHQIYEATGFNEKTESKEKFFSQFFVQDVDHNMPAKQMELRRPESFTGKNKELFGRFVTFLATQWYEAEYGEIDDENYDAIINDDEFWQVPLISKSNISEINAEIKRGNFGNKIHDTAKAIGNWFKNKFVPSMSGEFNTEKVKTRPDKNEYKVENPFMIKEQSEREDMLDKGEYSWDLRTIFATTMASQAVSEASERFVPIFAAFQACLVHADQDGGMYIPEIVEFFDKYIKDKVKGESILEDSTSLLKKALSSVMKTTSLLALGFNLRAMFRELLVSNYVTLTRVATHQLNGINKSDYNFALGEVIKVLPNSLAGLNRMVLLNRQYGMASQGKDELSESRSRDQIGIANLTRGDWFITSRIGDDYFRLLILVARMNHDGCYDAYVDDGNGEIHYDMYKDKRFSYFLSTDREHATDTQKWDEQRSLYEKYLKEWEQIYPDQDWISTSEYKPELPDAYSPKEKNAIRNQANALFGDFDRESKSLLTATFLGSAFMQYKTWLAARLNQHFMPGTFTSAPTTKAVKDENGNDMYIVASTQDEVDAGQDYVRFVSATQENMDYIKNAILEGRAEKYYTESGTFSVGMLPATFKFIQDLLNMDMDEFRRHWENPILKGQFINGMLDTFGLLVVMGLIKLLFGDDVVNNKSKQPWHIQWSYGVLMGFAQDGPITEILSSTFSDTSIPALASLQRIGQSAVQVLSGDANLAKGIVQSIGATKELAYIFDGTL